MATPETRGEHLVVLAPFGGDAAVVGQALATGGILCVPVGDVASLAVALQDEVGAVLLTEEALTPQGAATLAAALARQPAWSDLPVVLLLASSDRLLPEAARQVAALRLAGNITVLVRPVPVLTLMTAVEAALRARRRQYEVRDLIGQERGARERAEAATRLKDEFLATVSHELRTPLAAILIWGNLIGSGRVQAKDMAMALQAIESSAEAQSRMIEDLLDVSRMLSGKLHVQLHAGQLAPIAEAALTVVRPSAQARRIALEVQIDPAAGIVLADPGRMQQVLWNLLANAVKFTPTGGRVALRLVRREGHVEVQVSDTGIGIGRAFLPHVFERFRQADAGTTRQQGGLGLGLAIARQLVELHGGSVAVDSPGEDQGSTFTVRLPVVVGDGDAATADPAVAPPVTPDAKSVPSLRGLRVMLVENEQHTREAMTYVLEHAGAEVTATSSARAALTALAATTAGTRPHVLISDIGMPGEDGHALIRAVRAAETRTGDRPIPAVALTAYARPEDRSASLAAGFDLHISKPVEPDALVAAVLALAQITRASP